MNESDLSIYQNWVWDTTSPHVISMETPGMLAWAMLGLAAETGEVTELAEKSLRKNKPLDVAALEAELGDVLWYITAIANAADISMDDVMHYNMSKINERIALEADNKVEFEREDA